MPRNRYTQLSSLKVGNSDCRIKVRVVRYWKGVTKLGVVFKSFNIILLDNMLVLGRCYVIHIFQVQRYNIDDKFRCLRSDVQLIFSSETRIKAIDGDENSIENNAFDFYDHSELYELSKQITYLADVVGIIKQYEPLATLVNKHGDAQRQVKLVITDGKSSINVTFWDAFAENFDQEMNELKERPTILIIASSRVGLWNGEVDLSSVGGTQCYLNYDYYSVVQLRRKLDQVSFKEQMYAADRHGKVELLSAATIKDLGPEYIMVISAHFLCCILMFSLYTQTMCQRQVCAHLHIKYIEETGSWYTTVCTGCGDEVELARDVWCCGSCNRIVPFPDNRYKVIVVASDDIGAIELLLGDQQIHTLLEMRAMQLLKQSTEEEDFPLVFKSLTKQKYTVKLLIKEIIVVNKATIYWVTNICKGFIDPNSHLEQPHDSDCRLTSQASGSSYHLDGMSSSVMSLQ
ncbi:replication protein A 70 kDa DNA-binding subunit E-like isoform X2 [Apium graveolens]|uniref:replication protein A 70 kDa DNA-binding subunit E-like isoform X2 n=1 Tax=Apium graveolens TaxID=4045 RepID=UPI003D7A7FAA